MRGRLFERIMLGGCNDYNMSGSLDGSGFKSSTLATPTLNSPTVYSRRPSPSISEIKKSYHRRFSTVVDCSDRLSQRWILKKPSVETSAINRR